MTQEEPRRYPFVTLVYVADEGYEPENDEQRLANALGGLNVLQDVLYESDLYTYGKAYNIEMLTDAEIYIRTGGQIDICAASGECEEEDDETEDETYDYCPTPIIPALDRAEEVATGREED